MDEARRHARELEPLLDIAARAFFAGIPASEQTALRSQVTEHVRALVPLVLWPHYAAIVPDFWSWLSPGPTVGP